MAKRPLSLNLPLDLPAASGSAAVGTGGRKQTLSDAVYRKLSADIVAGRLAPGVKLGFEMLRREYGFGVSPLREALQRLTAENLVEAEGRIGFRVAAVSLKDLEDINRLRLVLEPMALADAITNANLAWEERVVAAAHRLKRTSVPVDVKGAGADRWEDAHRDFHDALISGCSSQALLQFARTLFAQFRRYRRMFLETYWRSGALQREIAGEHDAIVAAALARDAKRATAALTRHYKLGGERVVAACRKQVKSTSRSR